MTRCAARPASDHQIRKAVMARLSFHMIQTLVHKTRASHGRGAEVHRFKRHIELRSIRALKARDLIKFDEDLLMYRPTPKGEVALVEHGFSSVGEWLGSNHPRKYR